MILDPISLKRIATLHPKLRETALAAYRDAWEACKGAAKPRVTQALRTMQEQAELYAQGRTKPGKVVTWAPAGASYHNYGLALDFCLLVNGKEVSWDMLKDHDWDGVADWIEVVEAFKRRGFAWGGDWKKRDTPHFEYTFGLACARLAELPRNGSYPIL